MSSRISVQFIRKLEKLDKITQKMDWSCAFVYCSAGLL